NVLTSSSGTSTYGSPPTFTATVTANAPGSGTPTGTVDFKEGATVLCTGATLDGTGKATCTPAPAALNVGSHNITATYNGDPDYLTSTSNTVTHTVVPACVGPVADVLYTGASVFWTSSPSSSTASLNLTASLKRCG